MRLFRDLAVGEAQYRCHAQETARGRGSVLSATLQRSSREHLTARHPVAPAKHHERRERVSPFSGAAGEPIGLRPEESIRARKQRRPDRERAR